MRRNRKAKGKGARTGYVNLRVYTRDYGGYGQYMYNFKLLYGPKTHV